MNGYRLKALDEQPSPVELTVGPTGEIAELEQWPEIVATPSSRGEDDRLKLQDLCRKAVSDLADDVAKGLFGKFRDPYLVLTLERYEEYVPSSNFAGNILRADYQAKLLSGLRASTLANLPPRVAYPLDLLLSEHGLLRVFYLAPAASDAFIEQIGDAPPPSPERLAEIPEALARDASAAFEPGAKETIEESDSSGLTDASSEEDRPEALSVLFSYAWQPMEAQQRAQLELFERLSHLVDHKPPEFASLPKIELWRDAERLEKSHGADAQIEAASERAFLALVMMSLKYPNSPGCMIEFDRFVDASGANLPGKSAILVAVNCKRNDVDRRFSAGLRLWMDDNGRTLVESMLRGEPAKDRFAKKIARQIFLAARRHLDGAPDTHFDSFDKSAKASPINGPYEPPMDERLAAYANRPLPFSFEIDAASGKVEVAEHDEIAAFPLNEGEPHLRHLQTTCCEQAVNLLDDTKARRFGDFPESDFVRNLQRYIKYLPRPGHIGFFFLADDHSRELRALAEERATLLPDPFARDLRTLLKRHEQLRGYYRRTPKIDKATTDAGSLPPPPQDKLDEVTRAIVERGGAAIAPEAQEIIGDAFRRRRRR